MKHAVHLEAEIFRLLSEMVDCADTLATLLESECAAVKVRDTNTIKRLIDEKYQLISVIEGLETNRKSVLQAFGYATDHQGMEDCLLDLGAQTNLMPRWQRFLGLLDDCHHQNRVNGSLLNLSYRAVESVLQVLQGHFSEDRLYSPAGYEIIGKSYRSIAKF